MSKRFAEITFTASVKAAQRHYAGREYPLGSGGEKVELGPRERDFIAARDSFYLATVSENGWPYVQHRGAPAGFLRVLDSGEIAFADFAGNRQYQTAGNLAGDGRVSLILLDYPARRRLKILGYARVLDLAAADGAAQVAVVPDAYPARSERLILIRVEAFDWNCSQHITPRFTESEWLAQQAEHYPPKGD